MLANTFSPPAAARLLGVSVRHVRNLIVDGRLKAYLKPAARRQFIITRQSLVEFCQLHEIPLERYGVVPRIVVCGADRQWACRLGDAIGGNFAIEPVAGLLDLGIALANRPACVIVDGTIGRSEMMSVARAFAGPLVALVNEDENPAEFARVYDKVVRKPADFEEVASAIALLLNKRGSKR